MRNKKFKREYTILVEGVTTNGYAEHFIDDALFTFIQALDMQFRQVNVRSVSHGGVYVCNPDETQGLKSKE